MEAFIGSVFAFGFNFTPVDWQACDGTLLSIANNQPLFALIGTTYGGDGINSFAVPDLRGRMPIGTGHGNGLPTYTLGQQAGSNNVSLTSGNLPAHTHAVQSSTIGVASTTDDADPTGRFFGIADSTIGNVYETSGAVAMGNNGGTTDSFGTGTPINVQSPYLVVNYCICVIGIFPSRN